MKEAKQNHYVLGFERRTSGAFEHSWGVGQNLHKRGFDVEYFSHWWDSPVKNIDLETEQGTEINFDKISKSSGIYHLQTHTWEHEGLLKNIYENDESKLIYNLHAVIPYFYSSRKDEFLEGKISVEELMEEVGPKMGEREYAQLSAIEKADYLFAISEGHKKVLERMGVSAPVHVFENVSDFDSIRDETLEKARIGSEELRERLNVENVLLYCGALYGSKGSHRLFEAFRKIRDEHPSSKLVILGSGEERIDNLLSVGMEREDLKNVYLTPWISKNNPDGQAEFLKHYYASDVLIQPMITEGLYAKTVIDAMNVGLPTITCKSPYSIGQSKTTEDIVDAFRFLKENPEKVEQLTKSAKAKVQNENTWDSYISRMEEIISQ